MLGPGAFQEVDLSGAFGSVAAWSQPVLRDSNPVELMNLACKNALLRRDVAHLIFPDEVQTLPAPEGAAAGGPDGRAHAARRSRRPRSRSSTRCGCCAARSGR